MTEYEAIGKLDKMQRDDPEKYHWEADEIVLEFLRAHGHSGIADAFEAARDRVGFWYA